MIRSSLLVVAALLAGPASAQSILEAPQGVGVYLARDEAGALRVQGRPDSSMPLPLVAARDTSASHTRGESARRGAKTGALVGAGIGAAMIAYGAYFDLTTADYHIPFSAFMAVVAVPVVAGTTLIGTGIGYATGGD